MTSLVLGSMYHCMNLYTQLCLGTGLQEAMSWFFMPSEFLFEPNSVKTV